MVRFILYRLYIDIAYTAAPRAVTRKRNPRIDLAKLYPIPVKRHLGNPIATQRKFGINLASRSRVTSPVRAVLYTSSVAGAVRPQPTPCRRCTTLGIVNPERAAELSCEQLRRAARRRNPGLIGSLCVRWLLYTTCRLLFVDAVDPLPQRTLECPSSGLRRAGVGIFSTEREQCSIWSMQVRQPGAVLKR